MIKSFIDKKNYEYLIDANLTNYNTYRINSKCKYLIFPKTQEELLELLKFLKKNNYKYLILGNGSNIILKKDYYEEVIIRLDRLNRIITEGNILEVEAGYFVPKLANYVAMKGLSGLEFANGIPGLIGASIAMNAGAYKKAFQDVVIDVKVINPKMEIVTLTNEQLEYTYRDSFIKKNKDYIIVSARLKLESKDSKEILERISRRRVRRLQSQPLNMPSAGSVFRNPENLSAGALIEESNLKGYKIGGAEVSEKHANFIVNSGGATGEDIIKLIEIIKNKVKEDNNIDLILEQIIID